MTIPEDRKDDAGSVRRLYETAVREGRLDVADWLFVRALWVGHDARCLAGGDGMASVVREHGRGGEETPATPSANPTSDARHEVSE